MSLPLKLCLLKNKLGKEINSLSYISVNLKGMAFRGNGMIMETDKNP